MLITPHNNGYWVSDLINGELIVRLFTGVNRERAVELFNEQTNGGK